MRNKNIFEVILYFNAFQQYEDFYKLLQMMIIEPFYDTSTRCFQG